MIEIPVEIRTAGYRFILLHPGTKNPAQKWSICNYEHNDEPVRSWTEKFHKYDEKDRETGEITHYEGYGNYGLVGTPTEIILEVDTNQMVAIVLRHPVLQKTLSQVSGSGRGRHFYIKTDAGWTIPLMHPTEVDEKGKPRNVGHIKSTGSYCVGPNSIHPSGGTYILKNHREIQFLPFKELMEIFSEYVKDKTAPQEKIKYIQSSKSSDQTAYFGLSMDMFLPVGKTTRSGNEIIGSSRWHDSTSGTNYRVNLSKGTWYCARHQNGGGPLDAYAVEKGIIDCSDVKIGCLEGHWAEIFSTRELDGWEKPDKIKSIDDLVKNLTSENKTNISPAVITQDCYHKLVCNLEENNFITEWTKFNSLKTDAYQEYHHACGLALLSIASDRKFVFPLQFGDIFLNMWLLILGMSSTSRKSTSCKYANMLIKSYKPERAISDSFSPQSFLEQVSKDSHAYLILDEASGLLATLKQAYMSGMRELLCKFYDCASDRRKLRTSTRKDVQTDFNVVDPYMTMAWATTFKAFNENATELDVTSGLLARFLCYAPKYPKDVLGAAIRTDKMNYDMKYLYGRFKDILDAVSEINGMIHLIPSKKAFEEINKWDADEQANIIANGDDGPHATIHARMFVTVFKLSGLYYIGSREFIETLKNSKPKPKPEMTELQELMYPYTPETDIVLPDKYVFEALKNVKEYFGPVGAEVLTNVRDANSENIQVRIINYLKEHGGNNIKAVQVMNYLKIKSKEFKDHMETLEMGDLIEIKDDGLDHSNGKKSYIVNLLPTNQKTPTNKTT